MMAERPETGERDDDRLTEADRELLALIDAMPDGTTVREPRPITGKLAELGLVQEGEGRFFITAAGRAALSEQEPGEERLRTLLGEICESAPEFDDERVGYLTIQIDRDLWNEARQALSEHTHTEQEEERNG